MWGRNGRRNGFTFCGSPHQRRSTSASTTMAPSPRAPTSSGARSVAGVLAGGGVKDRGAAAPGGGQQGMECDGGDAVGRCGEQSAKRNHRHDPVLKRLFGFERMANFKAVMRLFKKFTQSTNESVMDSLYPWMFGKIAIDGVPLEEDAPLVC